MHACLVTESCPTLCDSMDYGLPGFSVHGISQARILESLPFPPSEELPDPGIEPESPASPTLGGRFFITELTGKPLIKLWQRLNNMMWVKWLAQNRRQQIILPNPPPAPQLFYSEKQIDNSKTGHQPSKNLSTYQDRNQIQSNKIGTGQVRTGVVTTQMTSYWLPGCELEPLQSTWSRYNTGPRTEPEAEDQIAVALGEGGRKWPLRHWEKSTHNSPP